MTDTAAYDQNLPCKNPNCKSHGRPHPNCKCYGLAHGGEVSHFCSENKPHNPSCEYYAQGGPVQSPSQFVDNPQETLDHAAVEHGLLGILKNIGHTKMADPDKHKKVLQDAKEQHAWRAMPDEMPLPKTHGTRLGNHIYENDHEKMTDHMHGHPLVGQVSKKNLKPIMERLSGPMIQSEPHPEGLRAAAEYLDSSIKGRDNLSSKVKSVIGKNSLDLKHNDSSRESLKEHLKDLLINPEKLLDVGGDLGHYLPNHHVQLAALSGVAVNYLNSIKPMQQKNAPLDDLAPIDKFEEANYNRNLDIAQSPMMVLQHTKDGTLRPSDIQTLKTIYPSLYQSIVSKMGESLIDSQDKGVEIPYKQRQTLSMLLDQPLDSTQTQYAMQAIIKSAGPQQIQQKQTGKKTKKASGVELNQINKVNELDYTPIQARQLDKKD